MNQWSRGAGYSVYYELGLFKSCLRQLQIFWLKIHFYLGSDQLDGVKNLVKSILYLFMFVMFTMLLCFTLSEGTHE